MINNINYQKKFFEEIALIKNTKNKPRLLLHVCCGPCLTYPLFLLKDYFDITFLFNNSNIYPKEEYLRRLEELKKYLKEIDINFPLIVFSYDNETYNLSLESHKDDKEGHERCRICFEKRLESAFKYAGENNFDYVGTIMSISRYKNAKDLNSIGEKLQIKYPKVKWLYADFKKNDGYEKSLLIIKKHQMYFQEYCGCIYSYKNYLNKKKSNY